MAYQREDTDRKNTPKEWSTQKDPKKEEHDATSYYCRQYRCGHYHIVNSTKGNEYWEMGSRYGDRITTIPGGGMQIIAAKGMTTAVFGEMRTISTGAQDTTARGAYSIRAHEKIAVTTDQGMETSVKEDMVTTAKNMHTTVGEKMHTVAQEQTTIVEKGMNMAVTDGQMTISASKGVGVGSFGESVALYGGKSATVEGESKVAVSAGSEIHVKVGSAELFLDGTSGKLYINSGKAQDARSVYTSGPASQVENEIIYDPKKFDSRIS